MAQPKRFWIVTNGDLRPAIRKQLPRISPSQILAEPVGRNSGPAIGLVAFLSLRQFQEAVIGMFPSDHVIADENAYRTTLTRAIEIAAAGENIVVLGVRPTRPETGYGYIETGTARATAPACAAFHGEAGCGQGRRVRSRRKFFLEQWNVFMERSHAGQCSPRTSSQDRPAAGTDCRDIRNPASSRRHSGGFIPSAKT